MSRLLIAIALLGDKSNEKLPASFNYTSITGL
jgi:hypothetical protein